MRKPILYFIQPFAKLRMHYQLPGENKNIVEFDVLYYFTLFQDLPSYYRFSASIALLVECSKSPIQNHLGCTAIMAGSYDPKDIHKMNTYC
jgi:hypothetical protein